MFLFLKGWLGLTWLIHGKSIGYRRVSVSVWKWTAILRPSLGGMDHCPADSPWERWGLHRQKRARVDQQNWRFYGKTEDKEQAKQKLRSIMDQWIAGNHQWFSKLEGFFESQKKDCCKDVLPRPSTTVASHDALCFSVAKLIYSFGLCFCARRFSNGRN